MNRYPPWKYLLIAVTLLVGLLYTLPNFFGEVPAVQVSGLRTNKADADTQKQIEEALKAASIVATSVLIDGESLKVRFKDGDAQLRGARRDPGKARFRLYRCLATDFEFARMAVQHQRAADVPRSGFARWCAFPDAGRHESGAR